MMNAMKPGGARTRGRPAPSRSHPGGSSGNAVHRYEVLRQLRPPDPQSSQVLLGVRNAAITFMSGIEWVVEAHGCEAANLVDLAKLRDLFAR